MEDNKKEIRSLSEEELEKVSGGQAHWCVGSAQAADDTLITDEGNKQGMAQCWDGKNKFKHHSK